MSGLKRLSPRGWTAVLTSCLCYFTPVSVIGSTAGKAEIRFRWDHSCHGFKNWTTSVLLLLLLLRSTARGKEGRQGEGSRQKPAICQGFLSNDFCLLSLPLTLEQHEQPSDTGTTRVTCKKAQLEEELLYGRQIWTIRKILFGYWLSFQISEMKVNKVRILRLKW